MQEILNKAVSNASITDTLTSSHYSIDSATAAGLQAAIDVDTPAASTFLAGVANVDTITNPAVAGATAGDHVIFYDDTGLAWAYALDTTGSSPAPTGALYTAVAAARKVNVDISLAATATLVCDAVRTALNALTGFSAAFTTSGTDTLILTNDIRGVVTDSVPYASDELSAGSITIAQTTAGVASAVNVTANTITKTAHGLPSGVKGQLTSTGTLPAGVTTGTDYWIIVVDANTYAFAASLALAQAGTKIDLTDQGTSGATHTFTATSIAGATVKMQYSMSDASLLAGVWTDVAAATSITADANLPILISNPIYKYIRYVYTITAGSMSVVNHLRAVNTSAP